MARERKPNQKVQPDTARTIKQPITVKSVEKIGQVLFEMRKQAGFTQSELAQRLQVTQPRVAVLENHAIAQTPSFEVVARVADACGYNMELVFRRKNTREMQK